MSQITYPPLAVLSAPQLRELIASEVALATAPLAAQLEAVERKLAAPRLRNNPQEIADIYGITPRTVRTWISHGRVDKKGKLRFLPASELNRGKYSISLEAMHTFLSFFE